MSVDLEWQMLDAPLATMLVDVLNKQLASATRPFFIGPIEVTSLDFGSAAPDVELVDLRDIYRDFLEDDEDSADGDAGKVPGAEDDDGYEWVSRRAGGNAHETPAYHALPPHMRYGHGPSAEMFASVPTLGPSRDLWAGSRSISSLADIRPASYSAFSGASLYRTPLSATPPIAPPLHSRQDSLASSLQPEPETSSPPEQADEPSAGNGQPNIQIHLHVNWQSNLRITLTTSLLINYPSPMFMSLPIKLSVTGLVFCGEIVVAYEGERRRVHLCILDDQDPYGPFGVRPKREPISDTPPELDEDLPGSTGPPRPSKPPPAGQRLLPNIFIESEIGQADKHVLKNVTRVERFIQDVIRKTVEEELVFPNFHTLILGDK